MKKVYTIKNIEQADLAKLHAQIHIDKNHEVFHGHFPEKSVLPGVIELEIIKTIVSEFFEKKYRLTKIKNAKYLGMILPDEITDFDIDIDYAEDSEGLKVKAIIYEESQKYLKFSGIFSTDE